MNGRLEREMQINEKVVARLKTLPPIFTEWYHYMIASDKTYSTASSYINYIREFMDFYTKGTRDDRFYLKVIPPDIDRYMVYIRTKKVNRKTVKVGDSIRTVKWSALKTFFDFIQDSKGRIDNPVLHTSRPRMKDEPEIAYLEEEEIKAMMRSIQQRSSEKLYARDMCIFTLGIATGLSISSLIQINLEDIDIERGTIEIIDKGQDKHKVYIGDNMKAILEKWLEARNRYFTPKTDALFLSIRNQRINEDTVSLMLQKYADGVVDKHVTPHVMRHSAATAIYKSTGDLYLCADFLHHKRIETTKRYASMSTKNTHQAVMLLDNMI